MGNAAKNECLILMKLMYNVIKNDELLKNIMKFGTKSARLSKIDLIVNLYTMIII